MIEDQLTRDERIRLEALAQANAYATMKNIPTSEVTRIARQFEKWIRDGKFGTFAEGN